MKLSKKSRYGLRALIDLAVNSHSGHVALNCIAERNHISPQYLEQVFAGLRKAGIVKSIKGPQGGYLLAHDPACITAASILKALEGSYLVDDEEMSDADDESGPSVSIQRLLIDPVNHCLNELLTGLTLKDLEEHYIQLNELNTDMYYI